jgi:glucose 1-dehydrogenase
MALSPLQTDIAGQVAIVTGASSGIGRGTALRLGAAGASVVVNHIRDRDAAEAVVAGITGSGGTAFAHEADVSDESQVEAMFAAACKRFGTVHILVNNAGIQRDSGFTEMTLDQWRQVIDVNLTGQFLCARSAVREFLRRGPQPEVSRATGKIICMSSVHQVIPWARHVNYATSKGGIRMLVQSLAQEVASKRIRVNAIAPGAIRTPINRQAWETEAARETLLRLIPYGRIGEPEDVAEAVLWLASDASDYVTGTTLVVDGGMLLYPGFAEGKG